MTKNIKILDILQQRSDSHGDANAQFLTAQHVKKAMHGEFEFGELEKMQEAIKMDIQTYWNSIHPVAREALDMIAVKISRIICGQDNFNDHWLDIEGYARLARDKLCEQIDNEESDSQKIPIPDILTTGLPQLTDPITRLQQEIADWADTLIPDRTAHNAIVKLMTSELPELLNGGIDDPLEFADVAILVFDIAHLQGIDIGKAIHDKMEINRKRVWNIDKATGLLEHVEEPNVPIPAGPLGENK